MFTINKEGVDYVLDVSKLNEKMGPWLVQNFHSWEPFTFFCFRHAANSEKIAIDIGAWIGLTAIWLSKYFKKVVCVEADTVSCDQLKTNLELSNCFNCELINKAIYNEEGNVIFGINKFLGNTELNESTSQIKDIITNNSDYIIKTILFSELIKNYDINSIGLVKVDIEGGEEFIFEEVIEFCKKHKVPLLLSFHISWWRNKNIERFIDLFKNVSALCENLMVVSNIIEFLKYNPMSTLYFVFKN
jgi:FkbM family methyltransferase